MNEEQKYSVSVVVCTHNGARTLDACCVSLENQTLNKGSYEVIIVNDASTDSTAEILSKHNVKIITNNSNKGLSVSRNIGIQNAQAQIIAFTDDDCVVSSDWLEKIVKGFEDIHVKGLGGNILMGNKENTLLAKYIELNNPLQPLEMSLAKSNNILYRFYLYLLGTLGYTTSSNGKRQVFSLVGANMSFRRSVLEKLNYFDPLFTFGGDEEDLCKRFYMKQSEGILMFDPDIEVKHNYNLETKAFFKRYIGYGSGNARLFYKHKNHNLTLYPFPILILLLLLITLINNWFIFILVIAPLLFYFKWIIKAIIGKSTIYLKFAYIQLATEFAINLGLLKGLLMYKNLYKR